MTKNKIITVSAILLIISIGTYSRIISNGTVRTVEFLSIFAIGALSAVLLMQIIKTKRKQIQ